MIEKFTSEAHNVKEMKLRVGRGAVTVHEAALLSNIFTSYTPWLDMPSRSVEPFSYATKCS